MRDPFLLEWVSFSCFVVKENLNGKERNFCGFR